MILICIRKKIEIEVGVSKFIKLILLVRTYKMFLYYVKKNSKLLHD